MLFSNRARSRETDQDDGFASEHSPGSVRHSIDLIRGQLRLAERLARTLVLALLITTIIFAGGTWSKELGVSGSLIVFATCCLVTVGGLAGGGVFGFLFGIPRLLQQADQTNSRPNPEGRATSVSRSYIRSNSNLEEISDWLTKIIVGLGLIHLSSVPEYIRAYGNWLDALIVFTGAKPPALSMVLITLTLAAAAMGFLFLYIETRTRITLLLLATETVRERPTEEQAQAIWRQEQFANIDEVRRASDLKPEQPFGADAIVRDRMPGAHDSADQWAAWAASQVRIHRPREAAFGWRMAIERDTQKNAELREKYAEVLQSLNRDEEALAQYEEARKLGGDEFRLRRRELLVALYVAPPKGFEKALEAADALARVQESRGDVWIKVWHLSALGQRHGWLLAQNSEGAAKNLIPLMESLVKEIFELVPDPHHPVRQFLRQLIDWKRFDGDPTENDLESLKPDKKMYELITKDVAA